MDIEHVHRFQGIEQKETWFLVDLGIGIVMQLVVRCEDSSIFGV